MQQSSATPKNQRCRDWVAEDSCILSILLGVPSCIYSFWHGVIPTSYFIFNEFYTCFTGLALSAIIVAYGEIIRRSGPGSCFLKVRRFHSIQISHHARK